MHQLPAFANMTMSVRRELCSVMVFEVVEQAGTVILHNKQEVKYLFLNITSSQLSEADKRLSKQFKNECKALGDSVPPIIQ